MNFSEYRKLTGRTMSDTGSKITDSTHMSLGLNTEIMGELPEAVSKEDLINFKEELGDAFWYLSNYCNLWNIDPVNNYEGSIKPEAFGALKLDKTSGQQYMIIFGMGQNIALLQDLDKKHLAYAKHADETVRKTLVDDLYSSMEYLSFALGLSTDAIRDRNIAKLYARYPESFDQDKAILRDLGVERAILEQ